MSWWRRRTGAGAAGAGCKPEKRNGRGGGAVQTVSATLRSGEGSFAVDRRRRSGRWRRRVVLRGGRGAETNRIRTLRGCRQRGGGGSVELGSGTKTGRGGSTLICDWSGLWRPARIPSPHGIASLIANVEQGPLVLSPSRRNSGFPCAESRGACGLRLRTGGAPRSTFLSTVDGEGQARNGDDRHRESTTMTPMKAEVKPLDGTMVDRAPYQLVNFKGTRSRRGRASGRGRTCDVLEEQPAGIPPTPSSAVRVNRLLGL